MMLLMLLIYLNDDIGFDICRGSPGPCADPELGYPGLSNRPVQGQGSVEGDGFHVKEGGTEELNNPSV